MKKDEYKQQHEYLKKILIGIFAFYAVFVTMFYFLSGDELLYRKSRANLEMPTATSAVTELTSGNTVVQYFMTATERLESISVLWETYYRENSGTVSVVLSRTDTNEVLMEGAFDASKIQQNEITTICADSPIEGLSGVSLSLAITSDSVSGSAISPLVDANNKSTGGLVVNDNVVEGLLCFSTNGTDNIWAGQHFWQIALGLGIILAIILLNSWKNFKQNKSDVIVSALLATRKYRFLIKQLVSRDFKTKYKRSVLGVFWSFLNPLLTMIVQYFIFSTLFRSNIEYYPAYLLIGIVSFNFFNEACTMGLVSIVINSGLITKVYMPKYIYPLTRVISSVINLLISLIPLLLVSILTGVHLTKASVLALYFLACLIIFALGIALFLSSAMVFFRDVQFLWNVFSMIWSYATPLFYPESIIPAEFKFVLKINPLYYIIKAERTCILSGISPDPVIYAQCLCMALASLLIGSFVFRKSQNKFVMYL